MGSLIDLLHIGGLWVEYDPADRLTVGPKQLLTDAARSFVRANRAGILAELKARHLDETVANIVALSPTDLTRYRAEVSASTPASNPWHAHDIEALRRADGIIAASAGRSPP